MTLTNLEPKFLPAEDNALVIRIKTSIGAIAFKAIANILPSSPTKVHVGSVSANITPITRPIATLAINGTFIIHLNIPLKKSPTNEKQFFFSICKFSFLKYYVYYIIFIALLQYKNKKSV